jgi:hypothetical protein
LKSNDLQTQSEDHQTTVGSILAMSVIGGKSCQLLGLQEYSTLT